MEQRDYSKFKQSRLKLFSRMRLMNIFSGESESIYKGEGIEFTDIKPFEPEDDLRDLDLLTLVQSGEEEIIQRVVERQRRIFIWTDLSGSMQRPQRLSLSLKAEIRDTALGLIVYSAYNAYRPIGLCVFDNDIKCFIPARLGEEHCEEIWDQVIYQDYKGVPVTADFTIALSFLNERVPAQSMIFFISDFNDNVFDNDFTDLLRPIAHQYDLIPVVIKNPLETTISIKRPINIAIKDNESNGTSEIYMTPQKLKEIQEVSAGHLLNLAQNFSQIGVEYLVLNSTSIDENYKILSDFFIDRHRIMI